MYRDFFSNGNKMNQSENPYIANNKTKNEYKTKTIAQNNRRVMVKR